MTINDIISAIDAAIEGNKKELYRDPLLEHYRYYQGCIDSLRYTKELLLTYDSAQQIEKQIAPIEPNGGEM